MSNTNIQFAHLRDRNGEGEINNRGGATAAFIESGNGKIRFAVAYCGPKDNFNKAYGRTKAAGRLNSDRYSKTFDGSREDFLKSFYGVN